MGAGTPLARALLGLLVAVALAQGALWAIVTPPLNGPDEAAHAAYAQLLAETARRPAADEGKSPLSEQLKAYSSAIGANSIAGHPEAVIDWPAGRDARQAAAGLDRTDGSGPNAAAGYPPLYYAAAAVAYRAVPGGGIPARLLAMRFLGVVLFGVTVALAWALAAVILSGLWPRAFAAGLVALQPKLGFMAGVINPDIMLVVLSTGFLVAAALAIRRGITRWRLAAMALTVIGACLTHPRGYYLVIPFAFTCWYSARREAVERGSPGMARAADGAAVAVLALVAAGTISLVLRWGNSSPLSDIREFGSYLWQFYLPRLDILEPFGPAYGYRQVFIDTYFSTFGQLDVLPSPGFTELVQAGVFLGLVLLFATVVARWETVRQGWAPSLLLASTVVSLLLLVHLVAYRDLQGAGDPIITGRYLLCVVAIYGVTAAWVLSSLPRRAGPVVAAPVLMIIALMTLGGISLSALRFYG